MSRSPTTRATATTVVELTPVGRGAVASVEIAGPDAARLVDTLFHPAAGKPLAALPADRVVYGRWQLVERGEDVVVARRADDSVAIHCHGGVAAVAAIVDSLCRAGAVRIDWRQWLKGRADDPIVAAAEIALTQAPTDRVATVLWDQRQGALRQAIDRLVGYVSSGRLKEARSALDDLLSWRSLGCHLTEPWRVVLAGRPNVGKSSLINALVGYDRAIVHPTPGTTRDLVTATTAWDGWPVELVDTAGLHAAARGVEAAGVALARARLATADLVLLVLDASNPLTTEDRALLADWPAALVVLNKCDVGDSSDEISISTMHPPHARVSAKTGEGLEALQHALVQRLVPHNPSRGQAVPFQPEQVDALQAAAQALTSGEHERAIAGLRQHFGGPTAC